MTMRLRQVVDRLSWSVEDQSTNDVLSISYMHVRSTILSRHRTLMPHFCNRDGNRVRAGSWLASLSQPDALAQCPLWVETGPGRPGSWLGYRHQRPKWDKPKYQLASSNSAVKKAALRDLDGRLDAGALAALLAAALVARQRYSFLPSVPFLERQRLGYPK